MPVLGIPTEPGVCTITVKGAQIPFTLRELSIAAQENLSLRDDRLWSQVMEFLGLQIILEVLIPAVAPP